MFVLVCGRWHLPSIEGTVWGPAGRATCQNRRWVGPEAAPPQGACCRRLSGLTSGVSSRVAVTVCDRNGCVYTLEQDQNLMMERLIAGTVCMSDSKQIFSCSVINSWSEGRFKYKYIA